MPPAAPRILAEATAALLAAEERLLACVHCGFCLPACPTYTRLGDEADSPRGRLYLMRAVAEGRLSPASSAFRTHLDRCTGCRACEPVCPAGVEFGALLERARAVSAAASPRLLLEVLVLVLVRWPAATRAVSALFRLLRASGALPWLARHLPRQLARLRHALAMLAASRPWPGLRRVGEGDAPRSGPAPALYPQARLPVAVFRGCVQEQFFGHVNRATARVLALNGCEPVDAPGQGCCGALHAHAGDLREARALARANLLAFERSGAEIIVANAAGCGAALKDYPDLFSGEPEEARRAEAFRARVRDLFELLATRKLATGARVPLRVVYDAPCHLRHAQRLGSCPPDVLRRVPGLEVVVPPVPGDCCGGAGIYGLLQPTLASRLLSDKLAALRSIRMDALVTPNAGCILQIGAGLVASGCTTPVLHPVEILDESYRRAGAYGGE